jgi:hypothetical protein
MGPRPDLRVQLPTFAPPPSAAGTPTHTPLGTPDERTAIRARDYLYAAVSDHPPRSVSRSGRAPRKSTLREPSTPDSAQEPAGATGGPPQPQPPPVHHGWPVLTLVNSGSVARDHLACERTFLAYVRTSLSIASMGVGALI